MLAAVFVIVFVFVFVFVIVSLRNRKEKRLWCLLAAASTLVGGCVLIFLHFFYQILKKDISQKEGVSLDQRLWCLAAASTLVGGCGPTDIGQVQPSLAEVSLLRP